MGRKKKQKHEMDIVGIIILIVLLLVYLKLTVFKNINPLAYIDWESPFKKTQIEVSERSIAEDLSATQNEESSIKEEDVFVKVFFTKISDGKDVYVAVSRQKPKSFRGSDVEYAIKLLMSGPTKFEKNKGVYSEIPTTTKLLWYKETPSKIIVNLSSDFEFGGGGESLYKRMYQLIKTANHNTRVPVYLYIDGKQANVIGGEGLMIKQPLRSNSLEE